jgi:hypothetical protein
MQNGQGRGFGERLRVGITVLAAPTVTPAPTQTPVAGISFSVDRTNIQAGECVTFQWKVDNVKEVYFYREGQNWPDHGVTGEGSREECPPETITYYLRVVLRDSSVETRQITIYVEPVTDAPAITRFTVDPPGQITLGQCVTIRWRVEGELDTVTLSANNSVLWDPAPAVGNTSHCPEATGTVTYKVEAVGPGGTSRQSQTVNVVDPATATPAPTAAPEAPVIHSFSVSPNQVEAGECMGISWRVGGGATYSRILRNGSTLIDDAGFTGQEMDCLDEPGTYTYRLEALNAAGDRVSQEQVGIVTEAAPENPLAGTRWQVASFFDAELGDTGLQHLLGQLCSDWQPVGHHPADGHECDVRHAGRHHAAGSGLPGTPADRGRLRYRGRLALPGGCRRPGGGGTGRLLAEPYDAGLAGSAAGCGAASPISRSKA